MADLNQLTTNYSLSLNSWTDGTWSGILDLADEGDNIQVRGDTPEEVFAALMEQMKALPGPPHESKMTVKFLEQRQRLAAEDAEAAKAGP